MQFRRAQLERQAARTPAARGRLKDAMTGCAASGAATVRRQTPARDFIPITTDQHRPAMVGRGLQLRTFQNYRSKQKIDVDPN
jgi:hypothetical protein